MNPILYIIVRNDLPSMNPGKAMAQASHASYLFARESSGRPEIANSCGIWRTSGGGFGTTIVLAANLSELETSVSKALGLQKQKYAVMTGNVFDPTYPYSVPQEVAKLIPSSLDTAPRGYVVGRDEVKLYRLELTCGYIFGDPDLVGDFVTNLSLHP